ncbi:carbohydrate-responsive element-binding protein-like isoform X2 [Megalops cyprinoides]|uniref:carbohydrate-responsive element-binding protein-like isoform X2 n=1 Tax=Megalops cyprinoides TaxID=118141 RepID=UPI001864B4AE|nr:carbohydrate-responsive element-binding protein-like isoform X2 [Megalops cyprinoides]
MAKADRMAPQHQLPDSESDSDPEDEQAVSGGTGQPTGSILRSQVIHSGHFMVSSPHSDSSSRRRKSGASAGYDFDTVNRTWCQTYKYGPRSSGSLSIDPTLTRLFECMTLAYSGKIVSPKWKNFKGLRLLWRDKIRLNNGIWRAWYIQYVEKRKNPVCGFVTPLEGSEADAHRKPEAIILEGSYWKRRIEVVIKEYHKWRIYYKKRLQKNKDGILSMLQQGQIYRGGLEKWSSQMFQEPKPMPEESHMFDLDCFLSDISDTLFTMTQKPCPWAGDRHKTYTSNADMIQPGLTPLQPNLDDFMDIPDIFMSHRGQPVDQAGYAEFGYFGSVSGSAFSTVSAGPLLHPDSQLTQGDLPADSSGRMSQPSASEALPDPGYHRQPLTSDMAFNPSSITSEPKYKGQLDYGPHDEYQAASLVAGAVPYGQQPYTNTTTMASTNIPPVLEDTPFLYPAPCHKYRYNSPATSTVITHTGSMINDPQAHSYPAPEMYPPPPCVPAGYPPLPSGQTTLAPHSVHHGFPAPQPTDVGGRGKYKQKTSGVKTVTSASPTSPLQTSCLAKLLSTGTQERKPAPAFDPTLAEGKGHRSISPNSPSCSMNVGGSSAQRQHTTSRNPGIPLLTPLHCQTALAPPIGPLAGSSHGSAVSALLMQGSLPVCTPLLVPKTEKLSPIQIYSGDQPSLIGFPGNSDQISPTNPIEKNSNPQSPHSFPGPAKMEPTKTETRRITHISAEQKRRFNIKLGFDTLHSLVTTLSSQPSIKISKATTLQKTAEYISKMQQERAQLHEEAQRLREEIVGLNSAINMCQQQLPATGVPITRQRFDHMREMFRDYVRAQTLQNWKFWIFSIIIEPLFESYNGMVSTASLEDLCRTTLSWLDQHCSLPALRPTVLSSLRLLSTSTSILTDPSLVPEQATRAVTQTHPSHGYS